MLITIALILVLSLLSAYVMSIVLHDPYYDIHAPKHWDVEIPDMTFDSRGLT